MKQRIQHIGVVLALFLCCSLGLHAQDQRPYLCEIGLQAGCGYYVGDAAPHIFMHPREAYGVHFRYKFTKRWAVQAKLSGQRIVGYEYTITGERLNTQWSNRLYNADVVAEFNFFRFGEGGNDRRLKPYTPYIFLGIGAGMYSDMPKDGKERFTAAAYLPLGVGFKWKFYDCVGLNIAWQHNIYFSDDLEAQSTLNNKHHLNGWNWMNCDLTGMFTVGLVFEFAHAPNPCRICNY